jgi:hypothetical protein
MTAWADVQKCTGEAQWPKGDKLISLSGLEESYGNSPRRDLRGNFDTRGRK